MGHGAGGERARDGSLRLSLRAVDANKLLVLLAALALLGGLDIVAGGRAADKEPAERHDNEVRGAQDQEARGHVCNTKSVWSR